MNNTAAAHSEQTDKLYPKGKHAIALARMGFKVFPLREDVPDAEPSEIKKPALEGDWKQHATTDEAQIEKWWSKRDYNIAVATLPGSDLVILDYDCKPGQNGAAALRTHELLDLPQSLRVRTPSGGLHVYFKAPKGQPIANSVSKVAKNVDVRGNERGGYVVAPGSTIHGKPYEFEGENRTLEELPDWLIKLATANRKKTAAKQGEVLGDLDDPAAIDRAAQWLRDDAPEAIEGQGGNNETFRVACRVRDFGLSEQTALDLLAEHWNEHKAHPPWSPDDLAGIVQNAYRYASLPAGISNAKAEFEAAGLLLDESPGENRQSQQRRKFKHWSFDEASVLVTKSPYLIKGLIDMDTTAVLYGASNVGKSFLALDLAYHVARGQRFHGRRVRQGLVVYFQLEGGQKFRNRIAAIRKVNPPAVGETVPLVVVCGALNLCQAKDVKDLIAFVREQEAKYGQPCRLINIDTLNRALPGANENAPEAMSAAQASIDRIRREIGAAVLVVHHTGWDAKHPRGHSSLTGAADTQLLVKRDKSNRVCELFDEKQRDEVTNRSHQFRLRPIELGRDDEGDPITTCTIEWVSEFEPTQLSPEAADMWEAFQIAAKEQAPAGGDWQKQAISGEQWEAALLAMKAEDLGCSPADVGNNRGFSGRSLRRLRQTVCQSGYVKKASAGKWVAS